MASAERLLCRQLPCLVGTSYEPWQGMWGLLETRGMKEVTRLRDRRPRRILNTPARRGHG